MNRLSGQLFGQDRVAAKLPVAKVRRGSESGSSADTGEGRAERGTTTSVFGVKDMAEPITRASIVLAANRALWGEVSSSVRKVFTKADYHHVYIHFVMDGSISDDDQESIRCVASELVADFPEHGVKESSVRLDAPTRVPDLEGWYLVFARRE